MVWPVREPDAAPAVPRAAGVTATVRLAGAPKKAVPPSAATIDAPPPAAAPAPLPTALLAEIRGHRKPRTAVSRALEAPLAAVAGSHPDALRGASRALGRLRQLIAVADPQHPPWGEIFGPWEPAQPGRLHAHARGDIDPADVEAALDGGNVREKMAMLAAAQPYVADLLHRVARRVAAEPALGETLAAGTSLDVAALLRRFAAVGGRGPAQFLEAWDPHQSAQQRTMRRPRWPAYLAVDTGRGPDANRRASAPFSPPLSERERRFALAWQQRRGLVPAGTTPADDFRLPQVDGRHLFRIDPEHPWARAATRAGMHTEVSVSGTLYRLGVISALLDRSPAQARRFQVAGLAHMLGAHHTYHELMVPGADLGLPYDASPQGMVLYAAALLRSHPPPRSAAEADGIEALRRALLEARAALRQAAPAP